MRKTILTETGQKIETENGVLGVCGNGRLGVSSFVLPLNSADACTLRSGVSVGKLAHTCPIKAFHILLTKVSHCMQREWVWYMDTLGNMDRQLSSRSVLKCLT